MAGQFCTLKKENGWIVDNDNVSSSVALLFLMKRRPDPFENQLARSSSQEEAPHLLEFGLGPCFKQVVRSVLN